MEGKDRGLIVSFFMQWNKIQPMCRTESRCWLEVGKYRPKKIISNGNYRLMSRRYEGMPATDRRKYVSSY